MEGLKAAAEKASKTSKTLLVKEGAGDWSKKSLTPAGLSPAMLVEKDGKRWLVPMVPYEASLFVRNKQKELILSCKLAFDVRDAKGRDLVCDYVLHDVVGACTWTIDFNDWVIGYGAIFRSFHYQTSS